MKPKYIGNSCGAANDRHIPFSEIVKLPCVFLPFQAGPNGSCGVRSALNGHLRDPRQRSPIFAQRKRQIANNEYVGIAGYSEVLIDFDASATVCLRASAFAEFSAELVGCDAAGPQHGLCPQTF